MLKDAKTFLDMASHPPLVVEHSRIHFAQTGSPRIGSLSHALGKGDASSQKLTFLQIDNSSLLYRSIYSLAEVLFS